jgi:hypothetical protein
MRHVPFAALVATAVACSNVDGDEHVSPWASPNQVEELIEKITTGGGPQSDAIVRLRLIGTEALPTLRKHVRHPDEQTRQIIDSLVRELEKWRVSSSTFKDGVTIRLSIYNTLKWPQYGESSDVGLVVSITNNRKDRCYIDLFDTCFFELRSADGLPLPSDCGRNVTFKALPPMCLEPGETKELTHFNARLRVVPGKSGTEVWMTGDDLHGGYWKYRVDKNGKGRYYLGLRYTNTQNTDPYPTSGFWVADTGTFFVATHIQ